MEQEIGPQYSQDKSTDTTGFLEKARLHQSEFRAHKLKVPYDKFGSYLTKKDAENGLNFYNDFDIFQEVKKRYPNYSKAIYANMLRSEHISFNFFVPLKREPGFGRKLLNCFLDNKIKTIDKIKIEYAPSPAKKYLNDKTSLDTYIEYTHIDNQRGIIGIEVKYTEHEYKLKPGSKEEASVNNENSKYYRISKQSNIYKPKALALLIHDKYRQVRRNQLLGESILIEDAAFKHFTLLTIFPRGNVHFIETSNEYMKLLANNNNCFVPVTYENFISTGKKNISDDRFDKWLNFLDLRYIVDA